MSKNELEINPVGNLIRTTETNFINGTTKMSEHVDISLYEDINKIEAYLNSKHTSGPTDALGRDKPFANICVSHRNIWFRATDLDRKNIKIRATSTATELAAFVATQKLQEWMRKENFGKFLNNWGIYSAGYNEAVVKFVEQNGELKPMVVPWTRLICDVIDFANNPKIEILELTPGQLRRKEGYDQELVEKLLETKVARETLGKEKKDTNSDYIKLYEIHGELPLSYLTGKDKDDDTYVQQMHVVSFVEGKGKGEFDDFCLVSGKEAQDPYMLTALLPEIDGSIGLKGSVKNLFEAQWMENHTIKAIKDQLDLASLLLFQTSDGNFLGQNALSAMATGDFLITAPGQPITQVANNSHDITSLQNFGNQWKVLGNEINGVSEAMMGQNPPAGSAWRQTQALLNENHSLFEQMTENKGLAVEEMLRRFVIPFIKRRLLNNNDEIVATLESNDIAFIDSRFIKSETIKRTNKDVVDLVLKQGYITPEEQALIATVHSKGLKEALAEKGNKRGFIPSEVKSVTWKDVFKDLEWELECDITGENFDMQSAMTTLDTTFKTLVALQGRPMTPEERMVFTKIMSMAGSISPVELSSQQTTQEPTQTQVPGDIKMPEVVKPGVGQV